MLEESSYTIPRTSVVGGGHKRWLDQVVPEGRKSRTVAYTPALVPSGCSLAKNSLRGPSAVTPAEGGLVEAVVERCSEGE